MSESYTTWLTAAVVLGAVALVAQAACLYLLYKAFQSLQVRTMEFIPKAEATLARAEKAMAESRVEMQQASAKAHAVMDLAHGQLTRVDQFVVETTGRARAQVDRAEALLDESLGRVRHTVGLLNDTVTRPVREMNAVSAGLRAAFGSFFTKRRQAYAETDEFADENVGTPEAVSEVD
jgi:hypothetical protein